MYTNLINTTDIQRDFKEVMARLSESSEPLVVIRDSRPAAVMMSFTEYQRLASLEKKILKDQMKEILKKLSVANKNISDRELNLDIEAARHATRRR